MANECAALPWANVIAIVAFFAMVVGVAWAWAWADKGGTDDQGK